MFKNSVSIQLTFFLAVVAAVTGILTFVYSESIPYLHSEFPSIRRVHDERPYVINSFLSFASLLLSFGTFVRFSAFKRGVKSGFGAFHKIHNVTIAAEFSTDSGVIFFDEDRRVLTMSQLPAQMASPSAVTDGFVGKRAKDVFPDNLWRLLDEVGEKAKTTRQAAAVEIADWSGYTSLAIGRMKVIATPAFENGKFLGLVVVLRNSAEIHLAEESAILHQKNYQVLFDNLQTGVAVFRPAMNADGGPDAYIIEANAAFERAFEGVPLPYTQPCSVVWPSFFSQDALREGMRALIAGKPATSFELFSPALGKHFAISLVSLPAGRVLTLVNDETEMRVHQQRVLTLNDQLQRSLSLQNAHLASLLNDSHHFVQAASDVVESYLERLIALTREIPAPASGELAEVSALLHRTLHQFVRYHEASALNYKDNALVYPAELVSRLVESMSNRYPDITFTADTLPAVVANQEILLNIIESLMVSLASLPSERAARIEIGGHGDFLNTGMYVAGWGFDWSSLLIEAPETPQPLDWTLTSDLDLAVVRRMVTEHGGTLTIEPTPDGEGIQLSFTVGTPT